VQRTQKSHREYVESEGVSHKGDLSQMNGRYDDIAPRKIHAGNIRPCIAVLS
jgi:hypothetical protein